MAPVLEDATKVILAQKEEVSRLKAVASQHPFYKYNGVWTRELQNLVSEVVPLVLAGGLESRCNTGRKKCVAGNFVH